jgi:hypothetical protein
MNVKPRGAVRAVEQGFIARIILRPSPARGAAGGEWTMSVSRIIDGLERSDAEGREADAVARLGFLEWVFTQPEAVTAREARAALAEPELQNPTSAAARAFAGFLRQATQALQGAGARRGRAARRLH